VRASEGEGEKTETRQDEENRKGMVVAQQACESLHGQESHTEIRGNEAAVAFCILSHLI